MGGHRKYIELQTYIAVAVNDQCQDGVADTA